jgi:hypothetical protein
VILLILASQVARITGLSHWLLVAVQNFKFLVAIRIYGFICKDGKG